jgi:aspartyl-tRNA(Asn)/glutamyl-tRNA(Gln) amidotransferase subunit B
MYPYSSSTLTMVLPVRRYRYPSSSLSVLLLQVQQHHRDLARFQIPLWKLNVMCYGTKAKRSVDSEWYVDPLTGVITNPKRYGTTTPIYQVKVGLEIHVQLNHCKTKLFSSGHIYSDNHTIPPNTVPAIHPYDLAVPGILPVLSVDAIRYAILMAGVLNCSQINTMSRFERKHYTYADLPPGYQITQQRWPIAQNGSIDCDDVQHETTNHTKHKNTTNSNNSKRRNISCRINRIQLEQDTAKTTSIQKTISQSSSIVTYSRIDMNRAGIPLCEIVTEPDLQSSKDASMIVQHLRQLLQHTKICSGYMQFGQIRIDCNVNIVPYCNDDDDDDHTTTNNQTVTNQNQNEQQRTKKKHPRVEVKNLNSIQQVEDCIQYEAYRQIQVLEAELLDTTDTGATDTGTLLREETRTYNALLKRTELLRYKDQQQDYRFIPEPDLPPCIINSVVLQDCTSISEYIKKYLPELPKTIVQQLVQTIGISIDQAQVITHHPSAVQYYRTALQYALSISNNEFMETLSWNDFIRTATTTTPTMTTTKKSASIQHLKETGILVANLLCNVLFHLVKEQNRIQIQKYVHHTMIDENSTSAIVSPASTTDIVNEDDFMVMDQFTISPQQLGEIVHLIQEDQISYTMAKNLINILIIEYPMNNNSNDKDNDKENTDMYISPRQIAKERNIVLITNIDTLKEICQTMIMNHPDEILVYQKGGKYKMKMEKLFIGKIMSHTNGNAHPERLRDVVVECLQQHGQTNTTIALK